jgi:hypothetical protein
MAAKLLQMMLQIITDLKNGQIKDGWMQYHIHFWVKSASFLILGEVWSTGSYT